MLFLHRLGYNFFNQNRLTYSELNCLIDAFNRENDNIKRESNKNKI